MVLNIASNVPQTVKLETNIAPRNAPANRDRYTCFVSSASTIAKSGGTMDQIVPTNIFFSPFLCRNKNSAMRPEPMTPEKTLS